MGRFTLVEPGECVDAGLDKGGQTTPASAAIRSVAAPTFVSRDEGRELLGSNEQSAVQLDGGQQALRDVAADASR